MFQEAKYHDINSIDFQCIFKYMVSKNIHGSLYNNTWIYANILDMNPHNPPRQLESLTFYNKCVYFSEYFSVNILTVQGTTFKKNFYIACYIDFMNSEVF